MYTIATRVMDGYNQAKGLAMPPIQVFASHLAFAIPPYNTGFYAELDGIPVINLTDLMEACGNAADKAEMSVPSDFGADTGRLLLDPGQVASILASSLGELMFRNGGSHKANISLWAHEAFQGLLPTLSPTTRAHGIKSFCDLVDEEVGTRRTHRKKVDDGVAALNAEHMTSPIEFLIKRAEILHSMLKG